MVSLTGAVEDAFKRFAQSYRQECNRGDHTANQWGCIFAQTGLAFVGKLGRYIGVVEIAVGLLCGN